MGNRGRSGFSKCFAISEEVGGREGIRTPDPLLAKQVLSQLSYTPAALVILLTSIPVAGTFRPTTNSPFLGTFGTTSVANTSL